MELWDLFDRNRRPLGRTHRRGTPMPPDAFHLVVFVWVFNSEGQTLLTRRAPEKPHYAGMWSATGGAVQAGETSLHAVRRELREETGIDAPEADFVLLETVRSETRGYFSDLYLLQNDTPCERLTMQPGETTEARWVSRTELEALIAAGEFAAPDVQRYELLRERFADVFR